MENVINQNVNPVYEEPENLKKWNWGAFFFSGLWGLFNGIYWPFFVLVGTSIVSALVTSTAVSVIVNLIEIGISIYLGATGREQAWTHKKWKSVEHFNKVQHNWAVAVLVVLGACIAIGVIVAIAAA